MNRIYTCEVLSVDSDNEYIEAVVLDNSPLGDESYLYIPFSDIPGALFHLCKKGIRFHYTISSSFNFISPCCS